MSERKKVRFMVIVPNDIDQSDLGTIFYRLQQNFKDYEWVMRSEGLVKE